MHCPVCNHEESKVVDSRLSGDGTAIRRRRECEKCGFRFSTVEEVELLDLVVVKRDGRREMYSSEKLAAGIRKALEKRPYTQEAFSALIHQIESDILKKGTNEITSAEVGEIIMERLRGFDKVAYIRFASVYRSFEDVKTFQRILDDLRTSKVKRRKK
ncbi:MAG: transcriptional regulator NrdR [Patescibacteria group bacterium]|jgi:transcriptional repressor NrdR|nr:transcriptional regulator NrdR [Patescibacteria group bacterium]